MLAFLYAEGSWTRGIFRRPAGARAVRELRDTLDSGIFQLPLTRDHVFVIAGVFKVRLFSLSSLPGAATVFPVLFRPFVSGAEAAC